jgi:hypothetical protein
MSDRRLDTPAPRWALLAALCGACTPAAPPTYGETCTTDADCAEGLTCRHEVDPLDEIYGTEGRDACTIACEADRNCPPAEICGGKDRCIAGFCNHPACDA